MTLALIVALPFLGALFPGLTIRAGRGFCAGFAGAFTALALALLAALAPQVLAGQVVAAHLDWLPQIGLSVNFRLDGLGLLFAGMILGIGLLIIFYAQFYLSPDDPMGRFYSFLMLFQGAMVGIVLSDNILLLLVFWELTSLSSFLLIGFWSHLPEGRQGARMALAVTGGGGLAMIAGMLLLGQIAGSYDLSVILTKGAEIRASALYLPALLLILTGCFAKSAQFPFQFWLPQAMAAPTPVSAYLHSATMVKAGIFLMARLWPVLAGTPEWFWIVTSVGVLTLLIGAKTAVFQHDLKAILAYSTVSHLGLITMLLGFGTKAAAVVAVFHIINHATFKAALFMCAGIVDHETHTRDIRRLGGLMALMPVTATIVFIAALSMAGIPPLNGFLSKEMMLEQATQTAYLTPWLMGFLVTAGSITSVAYSLRLMAHGFLGPVRNDYPAKPHDPGFGLWGAPALLAGLVVLIGLFPMPVTGWLVDAAAGAVTGGAVHAHIAHWHGWTLPLGLSVIAVLGGALVLRLHAPFQRMWDAFPMPQGKVIFTVLTDGLAHLSRRLIAWSHAGSLSSVIAVAVLALMAAGLYAFATGSNSGGMRTPTPANPVALAVWAAVVLAVLATVALHRNRLLALVLVGIVGLLLSLGFAWLSAPDLALTQITVEVVTIVLMLLALNFLPKTTPAESRPARRLRDAIIAGAAGIGTAALAYAMMMRDFAFPTISAFHLAQSKPGAGGTNAVNTIIVDFRGYDTFGEITVLGIAALLIFALVEALLRAGPANDRLLAWKPDQARAGDRHPMMLVVATRLMLPVTMMVGVYIYLRGHNLPGGGFVAGLVFAIALVMQYMASGFGWTAARLRTDYHALIACGVLLAAVTGAAAWLFGLPFLTSDYGYIHLWPLEEFEWATAALFDLGVFLTVLGAVMLALASLSRLAVRAGQTVNLRAFDIEADSEKERG